MNVFDFSQYGRFAARGHFRCFPFRLVLPGIWHLAFGIWYLVILPVLDTPPHRTHCRFIGEPTASARANWLRVPLWSAEDPLNLLQVMLAKGVYISSFLFPGAAKPITA